MKNLIILILIFIPAGIFAQESPALNKLKNDNFNKSYTVSEIAFLENNKTISTSPIYDLIDDENEYGSKTFLDPNKGEIIEDDLLLIKRNLSLDADLYLGEGMLTFSKDKKTVFFSVNRKIKSGKGKNDQEVKTKKAVNLQLFKASINEDGEWTNLEMLPFSSTRFSTGQPFLNEDDTKLYFVSDGPESLGRTDIFVVDLFEDGTYGTPKNLGPKINSREREIFPFINKDNLLLFSSDVHNERGDLDVFASKIFDHSVSAPIKLKGSLTIEKDDLVYNIDKEKRDGNVASNNQEVVGVEDIYASIDASLIEIDCQQEISGIVKNPDTEELLPNVKIILFDENDNKLLYLQSNETDASFSFKQSCNETYTLKGYMEGYLIGEIDIKTVNDLNSDPLEIVMNMSVNPDIDHDPIAEVPEAMEAERLKTEAGIAEVVPVGASNDRSSVSATYNFNGDNQVYTVQIGAFQGNAKTDKYIKLPGSFNHVYKDGLNRYFSGVFESYEEAEKYKQLLKNKGFNDAFVVGLKGENRF